MPPALLKVPLCSAGTWCLATAAGLAETRGGAEGMSLCSHIHGLGEAQALEHSCAGAAPQGEGQPRPQSSQALPQPQLCPAVPGVSPSSQCCCSQALLSDYQ